jgi:hypothetical protein
MEDRRMIAGVRRGAADHRPAAGRRRAGIVQIPSQDRRGAQATINSRPSKNENGAAAHGASRRSPMADQRLIVAAAGRPKRQYIVVENAGMVGEHDVARFGTPWAAKAWIERTYSVAERDRNSPACLYPEVCVEEDGVRSFEL